MVTSANKLELLQIADAVAREKVIDKEIVLSAMEGAIQRAALARYGFDSDIRANIDTQTGNIRLRRVRTIVETVENYSAEISLEEALMIDKELELGDTIEDKLPPLEFGRIAAQSAKQVIIQKVREAERDRQYEEYKDRIGEIVNGVVKRTEYGNVIIDLGKTEAIIRRNDSIPRENFQYGDRVRAYIYDVRREQRGPQIFLSRTHPMFMAKLFMAEVPEIYEGIIEIKAVARDPGSRAKIAVYAMDSSLDPVGACVGMRGSRVQAVVNELQGEKIDIIKWSPDIGTFVVAALQPASVSKVVLDEDEERIEMIIAEDQLSLAIGRRGQNVRLASELLGWSIDIITEAEESEQRNREYAERTALFIKALDVDEMIGQLLALEGFATVEELTLVHVEEIASIQGLDEEVAEELQARAREYLERLDMEMEERCRELGISDDIYTLNGITRQLAVLLGEAGVKSLEDFADCSSDDLLGWTERTKEGPIKHEGFLSSDVLSRVEADSMILQARVQLGWIEPEEEGEEEEQEPEDSDESTPVLEQEDK